MTVPVPSRRSASVLVLAVGLAACAAPRPAAPPPRPVAPAPAPLPAVPIVQDWRDAPLTPGDWRYAQEAGGSLARYGDGLFDARCDAAARRIRLSVAQGSAAAGELKVTITDGVLTWRTGSAGGRLAADLAVSDPGLDRIAFSRGRFMVEAGSAPKLILPAWPEFARVVEDCRSPVSFPR